MEVETASAPVRTTSTIGKGYPRGRLLAATVRYVGTPCTPAYVMTAPYRNRVVDVRGSHTASSHTARARRGTTGTERRSGWSTDWYEDIAHKAHTCRTCGQPAGGIGRRSTVSITSNQRRQSHSRTSKLDGAPERVTKKEGHLTPCRWYR